MAGDRALPANSDPPLNEVVLDVQARPFEGFLTPHLGLFWSEIRAKYPRVEVHPAIDPEPERFGVPYQPVQTIRVMDTLETPRCWFVSNDENWVLQLQGDRLVLNWRSRRATDRYPGYQHLRRLLTEEMERLRDFLEREELGAFKPVQCEITYLNHIVLASAEDQGKLEHLFPFWRAPTSPMKAAAPENATFGLRYIISDDLNKPIGRLHVAAAPGVLRAEGRPIIALTLKARGLPHSEDIAGALSFLDCGHEWIAGMFKSIASPAHQSEGEGKT